MKLLNIINMSSSEVEISLDTIFASGIAWNYFILVEKDEYFVCAHMRGWANVNQNIWEKIGAPLAFAEVMAEAWLSLTKRI